MEGGLNLSEWTKGKMCIRTVLSSSDEAPETCDICEADKKQLVEVGRKGGYATFTYICGDCIAEVYEYYYSI